MVCMCGGGGRGEDRFIPRGVTEVKLFAQTLVPFGLLFLTEYRQNGE